MLGYNTAFYDNIDNKWTFDRVNDLSATYFIKYSNKHYTYIQPLSSHMEDKDFSLLEKMSVLFQGQMYIILLKF